MIRVIFAELMRIHDHLLCCGAAALDLGAALAEAIAMEDAAGSRSHGVTKTRGSSSTELAVD
jgi:NADH:ubiquinone oxidoreductase subunit D